MLIGERMNFDESFIKLVTCVCDIYLHDVQVTENTIVITRTNDNQNLDNNNSKRTNLDIAKEVVSYLNKVTGKKYRITNKQTARFISGRINEDEATLEDFKKVIDVKASQWKGTSMEQFLRPSTLFAPTKFHEYLQEEGSAHKRLLDLLKDDYDNESANVFEESNHGQVGARREN